ncbi:type II secretion system F family protein [Candidatus Uhrbacteria bacterium]|nr:type II secretion system F family protein [Candidatus Uhrbacteria bacterium]
MPTFKYRARSGDGAIQAGLIEAEGTDHARQALEDRGMELLALEPYTKIEAASQGALAFLNRITPKDLVIVTRALSVMISAAVPLPEAMRNVARQTKNPNLQRVLTSISNEIEGGARLSDAFEHHPKVFSGFFINMVRSGETSGQLADVLEYLAEQQEKDFDLMSKLKGALIYPIFILVTMAIVGFVMMTFVVPKLVQVLQEANVELPIATRILIGVSGIFSNYWWLIIILTIGAIVGVQFYVRTPRGRYYADWILLHLPIFGGLFRQIYVVRFCRSLGTLLHGGVDLVEALEIVANVVGNELWRNAVYETIREVNDGNSLVTAFQRHKFIPTMVNQMLSVGEGTGKTQDILQRIAAFYAREVDNIVGNLTKLIEPLVLIILGLGVGIMVSAIMIPLYSLSGAA